MQNTLDNFALKAILLTKNAPASDLSDAGAFYRVYRLIRFRFQFPFWFFCTIDKPLRRLHLYIRDRRQECLQSMLYNGTDYIRRIDIRLPNKTALPGNRLYS